MPIIHPAGEIQVADEMGTSADTNDVETWIVIMGIACSSFSLMLTTCRRRYWSHDAAQAPREYIQKTSWIALASLVLSALISMFINKEYTTTGAKCIHPYSYSYMLLCLFLIVAGGSVWRYLAVVLAHSDSFSLGGFNIPNPRQHSLAKPHTVASANTYKQALSPYVGVAMTVTFMLAIVAMGILPVGWLETLTNYEMCFPEIELTTTTWGLYWVILVMLPSWLCVAVEGIFSFRKGRLTGVTGYEICPLITNSPYVMGLLAISWGPWLCFLCWQQWIKSEPLSQTMIMLILQLVVSLDSIWLLILCIMTSRKNNIIRI